MLQFFFQPKPPIYIHLCMVSSMHAWDTWQWPAMCHSPPNPLVIPPPYGCPNPLHMSYPAMSLRPLQNNVDPNTIEEFLKPEEYVDHEHLFATDRIFNSKLELVNWAKETAIKVNMYLIFTRYLSSRTFDRRPYVTLNCERGGANKPRKKPVVDDEEEEIQVKRQGPYGTKKCGCPFKLKGERMAMCENWQVFVHDGRHNHAIGVYTHGYAPTAKLMEEQLIQIEQFRKSHVPPCNILRFFREQNVGCAVRYNMPLLEVEGMTPIGILKEIGCSEDEVEEQTTNRAESEYSMLKLWLSTCHGNLDTMFLNIDSLIEGQIADVKTSLAFSKTKEKNNTKSNHIFCIGSNKISHLALKKIWSEIARAARIYDDPKNKCGYYLRTSHGLPCACELITRFDHVLSIQLSDIEAFWKTLEIGGRHPSARQKDMDSEMCSLTDLLHQISTRPISKVREMRRLAKRVLNPLLPEDPGVTLTSPPKVAVTKGRKKENSAKRDKLHWEHVSIAHRKIQKSSGSGSGSGSGTGSGSWSSSGSGSGSCRRGRPPRAPRGRGRGNWKNVIGDGNCSYWVVADFVFSDEHQWPEVRRRMLYELEHSTNVYVNLVGSELGSTTVLPLYSYSDRPRDKLVIGLLTEPERFIQLQLNDMCLIAPLHVQWIHHRTERVSN
ncbi:hypothetical protein M9H77_29467 [Catharanthus roseus]|uniref:Uncharacterized protein n=1 Tax=Catharanthus roseus TaxID=4058 RepID=A0ACB9ZWD2_CATRO|nr:hypothetical protein M9H77_29467 [Catharanthus roseus]